jgi:hypothetical protein
MPRRPRGVDLEYTICLIVLGFLALLALKYVLGD